MQQKNGINPEFLNISERLYHCLKVNLYQSIIHTIEGIFDFQQMHLFVEVAKERNYLSQVKFCPAFS